MPTNQGHVKTFWEKQIFYFYFFKFPRRTRALLVHMRQPMEKLSEQKESDKNALRAFIYSENPQTRSAFASFLMLLVCLLPKNEHLLISDCYAQNKCSDALTNFRLG